jgi:hypothetical protein
MVLVLLLIMLLVLLVVISNHYPQRLWIRRIVGREVTNTPGPICTIHIVVNMCQLVFAKHSKIVQVVMM